MKAPLPMSRQPRVSRYPMVLKRTERMIRMATAF